MSKIKKAELKVSAHINQVQWEIQKIKHQKYS